MRRGLAMAWSSEPVTDGRPSAFAVEAVPGEIRLRGHLSTGTRGWTLRGEAEYRRAVITLHVTAIEHDTVRVPDLEFHIYEARINVRRPGRYHIRIAHAHIPRGETGSGLVLPVFEGSVTVP